MSSNQRMDKYLLHSHTTEHNYKKEWEYMQRHAWKKPETKVYTLIPPIYNFLENNTCYKKQETDWWFPGTGGEEGRLSVKDKVISGGGEAVMKMFFIFIVVGLHNWFVKNLRTVH